MPQQRKQMKGLSTLFLFFFYCSHSFKSMAISKAWRPLLVLLLLSITFFYADAVKPCPPPPTKQATMKCPRDTVKFGVCGSWLGLVYEAIGTPPSQECCSLVRGVVDLEAAVCLCTALKTNIIGVAPLKIPVALTLLLNSCGKKVPEGFVC